jgi:hypothetical protein
MLYVHSELWELSTGLVAGQSMTRTAISYDEEQFIPITGYPEAVPLLSNFVNGYPVITQQHPILMPILHLSLSRV